MYVIFNLLRRIHDKKKKKGYSNFSRCTLTPRHREHFNVKYVDDTAIISCSINNEEGSFLGGNQMSWIQRLFEKLVLQHISNKNPALNDPHQYAFQTYLLPSTQSPKTQRIRTSECQLSIQHNVIADWKTEHWAWVQESATGYSTNSQADLRQFGLAVTSPPH